MKIAFVCIYCYPSICGVWNRVFNLSLNLIKQGHEVHVFSTNIIKGTNECSKPVENFKGIKIHRFKPFLSFGENVKFWNFSQELKNLKPDLIISEVYRHPHNFFALRVARQLKKPSILETHAPFVEKQLRSPFGNLIVNLYDALFGRYSLNHFDKIVNITKWEVPYLTSLGADKKKLFYIPNSLSVDYFMQIPKKGKGILFLGRISPIKNLEVLISAIALLKQRNIKANLKIIGPAEEEYKNKLSSMISGLSLEENIQFLPKITEIDEKIKAIDDSAIFILPSKREAMPQSLIEAMARGKLVIASRNQGTQEIISPSVNGFLFSSNNAEELSRLIESCLKMDKKQADLISKNSIKKAQEFNEEKIFQKFYNLIQECVK
jgi:glycosyltransferase involved in cell wall biosynthesis